MNELCKLLQKMNIRRRYLFLLLLRSPFDAFRTWLLANLMKSVFLCLETNRSDSLLKLCAVYGLLCTMLFLYNGTVWSYYAAFSARTEALLQKIMLTKILSLPLKQINNYSGGEWITKLNSDIHAAFMMMNGPMNIPHLIVAILNTTLSSLLMFQSNLVFFGITWLFLLPPLWINYQIVLKAVPGLKEASQYAMSENTSAIRPLITEADTILLYDAGELMMKNCMEYSRKLMKVNRKIHLRRAFSDIVIHLFGLGGYFLILLIGYRFILTGTMAFSDVVYCFQVRGSILGGMFMLLNCLNNIKINSVCLKRSNRTLEE